MTELAKYVERVARGNPEVTGVLVIDGDGRVHAAQDLSDELLRAATAVAVPLRDLLDRAAAELGCGALRGSFVEGDAASFALADVDGNRAVIVVGSTGAAPGALRADSLWLSEQLRAADQRA